MDSDGGSSVDSRVLRMVRKGFWMLDDTPQEERDIDVNLYTTGSPSINPPHAVSA